MARAFALFTLIAFTSLAHSAPPAGSWKMTLPSRTPIVLLVSFSQNEGKWVGDVIDVSVKLRTEPKFTSITVNGDSVKFGVQMDPETVLNFDGVVAKDGKTLKGSYNFGGENMRLLDLAPSTLKNLQDPYELAKESLAQTEDPELAMDYARDVLKQATAKKMPPDDARAMLDRVGKLAAGQGRRWERFCTLKLADALVSQEAYAEVALAQARKAERMLTDDDDATVRMATLDLLVRSLLASKKMDDAKPYMAQLLKLEAREYADWAKANPAFKIEEFKARKAPNDRVVLVELFSGCEFEPSAAIDAARDGLLKTYKPSEVIVLTYQLPLNNEVNPLTVPDSLDRIGKYTEQIQRGQHGLVAGKPSVGITQTTKLKDAETIFKSLTERINTELELPAKVKLALAVTPDKDGYTVKANVTELANPGDKMMLRFALVEDRIRHTGGNGTKFHHMVVRALPGGAVGFPLKAATGEQVVTIKPGEIKAAITKYLTEAGGELPVDKMTALKNLKVIAWVQNDATGDILTAAQADVK